MEGGADKDDDPAAEWLYLLFTRFAQECLLSDLYDAVGVRTRANDPRDGVAGQIPRTWEAIIADAGPVENGLDVGGAKHGGAGVVDGDTNEPDAGESFSEVTPEQLIVLNLAEIAAGMRQSLACGSYLRPGCCIYAFPGATVPSVEFKILTLSPRVEFLMIAAEVTCEWHSVAVNVAPLL